MATRNESVRLSLIDDFTTPMAKAAAATAVLNRNLHDLDGSSADAGTSLRSTSGDVDVFTKSTRRSSPEIDRFSGRLTLLRDAAITIGPAFAPITAAVVPALAGLSAQLGATVGAVGVAVLAFNGIGDALDAMNDYQLEPTADNLEKLNEELTKIGPAGADFVMFLDSIGPQLSAIQDTARAGLLPGVQEGIESLLVMGPQVQRIVANIAAAMGEMASRTGEALSGERFRDFFNYIENTAGPTLMQMGQTLGNVTEGLANMMVAFAPAANDFTGGLERMTASFAEWSRGLESNTSFQNFLDYARESGPQVVALLGSIVNTLVGLGQAAAPVGAVVVPALTALANAFAAIAASPIGAPILAAAAAFVAFNRAMQVGGALYAATARGLTSLSVAAGAAGASLTGMQKALGVAAIAFAGFQAVDMIQSKFDGLSTGTQQLTADLLNLAAQGSGAKLAGEFSDLAGSLDLVTDPNKAQEFQTWLAGVSGLESLDSDAMNKAVEQFGLLDEALTGLVSTAGPEQAAAIFSALTSSMGLTAEQTEALMAQLPGYEGALAGAANAARLAGDAAKYLGNAEAAQARATREAVAALRAKRDATLAAFDAETAYRQALKDATAQAKTNTAGIRGNSDAALANRGALSQLASAWNNQSAAVRNNTGKYREARAAFIATAESMGVTKQRARELANEILAMPKSREIKITADTSNAMAALYEVQRYQIADKIVRVHTVRTSGDGVPFVSGGRSADGSTVPKDGGSYADRFPYMLAPGEEVISNRHGQADRHRALLKAINAGRLADGGTVRGLADGGTSSRGGIGPNSQLYGINSDWLSAAELALRITNLSQRQLADLGRDMEKLGKGSLQKLSKALDKAATIRERQLTKEVEAAKEHAQAQRDILKDLRASSLEFRNAVAANFRAAGLGSSVDLLEAARTGAVQLDMAAVSDLATRNGMSEASTEEQVRAYLASLSASQISALEVQAQYGLAGQQTRSAKEFEALLAQLTGLGLDGALFKNLAASGNAGQAQYLATLSPEEIDAYEQRFKANRQAARSAGSFAADAEFKTAIRDQTREMRSAVREFRESNTELKEHTKLMRQFDNRLERLEKATSETGPKKTAEGVGKVINDAAAGARR